MARLLLHGTSRLVRVMQAAIAGLVLIVIGLVLVLIAMPNESSSIEYVALAGVGGTLIMLGLTHIIFEATKKSLADIVEKKIDEITANLSLIEERIEKKLNGIATQLPLIHECEECGIVRIFKSRRKDPDFPDELAKELRNTQAGSTLYIMSNSLRDIFSRDSRYPQLRTRFLEMLEKNVRVKIMLLDPFSSAAERRAIVEEQYIQYRETALFKNITEVACRLCEPIARGLTHKVEIEKLISNNVEVRFCPCDPTTHLVITDKFTFTEQYHTGRIDVIGAEVEGGVVCFGGYVPVVKMRNSAMYAKLLYSHFENLWDSKEVKDKSLRNYYMGELQKSTNRCSHCRFQAKVAHP